MKLLSPLSETDLNLYDLKQDDFRKFDERTLLVTKFDWDYDKAHAFQRRALILLETNPQLRIIIACSHPRVFTHGRGLQRAKKGEENNLVEFNPSMIPMLPFPFFQIERGGGLTFHHPGQMIIYPIVRLSPEKLSLSKMMNDLFDSAITVLKAKGLNNLVHQTKLLGLWHNDNKLASMGIAIEKLKTFHGMALNFYKDDEMKNALRMINPCGLNAQTYISVEELIPLNGYSLNEFTEDFLKELKNAWK